MRDKFGNYTVMLVPHIGGSKMSEIWHHMIDPDRFKYLVLVLNEYTQIIDDMLIEAEKRFLGANWMWDLRGVSAWSNDFYVGLLKLVAPALSEVSKWYPNNPWTSVFFVNTSTMYAYIYAKVARRTGVGFIQHERLYFWETFRCIRRALCAHSFLIPPPHTPLTHARSLFLSFSLCTSLSLCLSLMCTRCTRLIINRTQLSFLISRRFGFRLLVFRLFTFCSGPH